MNVREEYEKKLISAEEAVKMIENGYHITLGGAGSFAQIVDKYLAARDDLKEVLVSTFTDVLPYEFLRADPCCERFKWASGFIHMGTRPFAKNIGTAMYVPNLYSDVPKFIEKFGRTG